MATESDVPAGRIWTIGHSTHPFETFVELLAAHGIQQLADVRSFPASRRHPHFARPSLEVSLPTRGIAYRWMPALGGMRKADPASTQNAAWRVEGFRGYADYMQTPQFATAVTELEAWARHAPTAFMCAEAKYWQCHRQLLSDALVVRGWQVMHILSEAAPRPHALPSFARVEPGGRLTYPAEPELPLFET